MSCKHREQHEATVSVSYLEDSGRFAADIQIKCAECGRPFRFIGLPVGLNLNGAAVSVDLMEARLAVHPTGEYLPEIPDDMPSGFSVRSLTCGEGM